LKKLFFVFFLIITNTSAMAHPQSATEKYFSSIKNNPDKLQRFLHAMPKGGDIHTHLAGASLAENMFKYAKNDNLCVDEKTFAVSSNPQCTQQDLLDVAIQNPTEDDEIIDAWSMRHFQPGKESRHDHFFNTFKKYSAISAKHSGEMLAEITGRAGQQNEVYLEIMVTPDNNASGKLGGSIGWDPNLVALRKKLLEGGLPAIVSDISKNLDNDENTLQTTLSCKNKPSAPGCQVKIRYLYQILREQPPAQVFAQLLAGFEVATKDPRVVGINMVQPEDGKLSMQDYRLHMSMVGFLHTLYPSVKISLHAGELVPGLVPPDGLRFHIREAIETAHASRIGHGVDICYEDNSDALFEEMANKHILVEINLTSNAMILGLEGKNHPLPLYLQAGVPVTLSTDDEGVNRADLTKQYQTAVLTFHFNYRTLKTFSRNALSYSFLPGKSLWQDFAYRRVNPACAHDKLGSATPSARCQAFLTNNGKASSQWELEKRYIQFENGFTK
jgi:adenosine deaminase